MTVLKCKTCGGNLEITGLCQYCGGTFKKGLFSTECTNCGKPKDY